MPEANPIGHLRDMILQGKQRPVLDDDNRILPEYAFEQQALGVERGRRHRDLDTWHVREPGMQALRVLRTLSPATAYDRSDDDRKR